MSTTKNSPPLTLIVGRTYRAKRPAPAGTLFDQRVNDRTIVWIGLFGTVQYDSPSVAFGRHLPKVDEAVFRRWASHDVTDQLPEGEYASWPIKAAAKETTQ